MEKSVLITGAYGGMGREVAKALAQRGFLVFALDKRVEAEEENILPIPVDLSCEAQVQAAFEQVSRRCSELFAILHFAGIYVLDSLVEMSGADFENCLRINLTAAFHVNRIFLPLLRPGSRIVITTSELAPLDPLPFTGVYALTKGALDKYAYSLRMELQLKDVQVSVLRSGAVATNMLGASTAALERFCRDTSLYTCNAERFRRIVNRVEARCVPPEKIARRVGKILDAKHPRFAYSINRNLLLLLLNLLPKALQCRIIKWVLS